MLRERHFRLGELRMPLLLPLDRNVVVVATLFEQAEGVFDGDLALAQKQQLPGLTFASAIFQMDIEQAIADVLERLAWRFAHARGVVHVPDCAYGPISHLADGPSNRSSAREVVVGLYADGDAGLFRVRCQPGERLGHKAGAAGEVE